MVQDPVGSFLLRPIREIINARIKDIKDIKDERVWLVCVGGMCRGTFDSKRFF